jgi:PDZ domain-containing protein
MDTEESTSGPGVGPGTALAGDPQAPKRKRSWLSIVGLSLVILLIAGVLAGFVVRVDYSTIAPGEALSLPPRVTIDGAQSYPTTRGDIRLLFVREAYNVNFWQYVRARLDKDIDLVKDEAINPGSLTPKEQNDQGLQQMADAKNSATEVALRAAGYKVTVLPGLTVSDLSSGFPAIKVLYWGDVILTADGKAVTEPQDLTAAVAKHAVGSQITLGILRGTKHLTVKSGVSQDQGRHIIGVVPAVRFKFPFKVNVDTTGIGGPSAGLAMTLAIYDDLTSGDLTGGHHVAVTGTIDDGGNVGEIGGIAQKAVAARAAQVTLFIVPQCAADDPPDALKGCKSDLARASQRAGSKIKVVPVGTFQEALKVLRDNGGEAVPPSTTTTVPKTSTTIAA